MNGERFYVEPAEGLKRRAMEVLGLETIVRKTIEDLMELRASKMDEVQEMWLQAENMFKEQYPELDHDDYIARFDWKIGKFWYSKKI